MFSCVGVGYFYEDVFERGFAAGKLAHGPAAFAGQPGDFLPQVGVRLGAQGEHLPVALVFHRDILTPVISASCSTPESAPVLASRRMPPEVRMRSTRFLGVSEASIFPLLMMMTRLQVISTSGRMCVEMRMVWCLPRFLMSSRTCRIWFGSRPMVGSSRMRRSGSWTSASARSEEHTSELQSQFHLV